MSVLLTNDRKVAMYDSVSGFAFGPTFDSEDEASEFVDFLYEEYDSDPRALNDKEMEEALIKFEKRKVI